MSYTPPMLNDWLSNLAGILPLSALIEFTDFPKTLHSYELSGRGLLWNWLVTPAGSRLLLSNSDKTTACCLDQPGRTPPLHCIDGRWGDCYPCSSPFTIRTCISQAQTRNSFDCTDTNLAGHRRQRLEIVRVSRVEPEPTGEKAGAGYWTGSSTNKNGWKWLLITAVGWLLWITVLATSVLSGQYLASAYLVTLLFTGLTIRYSHGHKTRKLLYPQESGFSRMVVLCDSVNGNEWVAFIGGHRAVDSLLNKPLYQVEPRKYPMALNILLRLLVFTQWGLTAVACAFHDWNGLIISAWIAVCAFTSAYVYSEYSSVDDWLRMNHLRLEKVELNFSTRRAMLSTLVTLNPDRENTKWIDPILNTSDDRQKWEEALLGHLENGLNTRYSSIIPKINSVSCLIRW